MSPNDPQSDTMNETEGLSVPQPGQVFSVTPATTPAGPSTEAPTEPITEAPVEAAAELPVLTTEAATPVEVPYPQPETAPYVAPAGTAFTSADALSTPVASLPPSKKRFSLGKKKLTLIVVPLAVVLLSAGGVFGLYLPNRPNAVWSTGINRSGKAVDQLLNTATEQQQLQAYKTSQITGNVTAKLGSTTFSGNLTSKFDDSTSDSGLNIALHSTDSGAKDLKLNLQVLTDLAKGATYPDIYFKLSGFKDLGYDALVPNVNGYDGKWILASGDYLKSLGSNLSDGSQTAQQQLTAADVSQFVRSTSAVTKQYVFTTDPQKAVLQQQRFVGKETVDGLKAYHYKATLNDQHMIAYCKAVSSAAFDSDAYKHLTGADAKAISDAKQNASKSCDNPPTSTKPVKPLDIWIDAKYKLIHKVRVYDTDSATYTEVGQNYQGGDAIGLFVNYIDPASKSKTNATLTLNTKTNVVHGSVVYADNSNNVTVNLQTKPLAGKVTITKPTDAVSLQDVLKALGLGEATSPVSTSASAGDAVRQMNIHTLQAQLEVYAANNTGTYPTQAELQNAGWRATNMPDLDESMFTADFPYSYQSTGCSANGCANYTLSVPQSSGQPYSVSSMGA